VAGSTFFLHSRINKQTTRQASLAVLSVPPRVDGQMDEPGEMGEQQAQAWTKRLGVSTASEWSRWTIKRVDRSTPDVAAAADNDNDDGWIWYGDEVILVEVQSGWRTEPLILCRVEGKSVVFDESASAGSEPTGLQQQPQAPSFDERGEGSRNMAGEQAAASTAAARNGGSVGQLSKVAFRRPMASGSADNSGSSSSESPRWYLSCAPRLDNPPGGGLLGVEGRPVVFVAGGEGAPAGRDKVDDFSLFTIGSIGAFGLGSLSPLARADASGLGSARRCLLDVLPLPTGAGPSPLARTRSLTLGRSRPAALCPARRSDARADGR
jgi:hypothetical protein